MSRDKTESVVKKGRPGHGSAAGPVSTPAHDTASDQIELKIITMSGAPMPRWQRSWAKVSIYSLYSPILNALLLLTCGGAARLSRATTKLVVRTWHEHHGISRTSPRPSSPAPAPSAPCQPPAPCASDAAPTAPPAKRKPAAPSPVPLLSSGRVTLAGMMTSRTRPVTTTGSSLGSGCVSILRSAATRSRPVASHAEGHALLESHVGGEWVVAQPSRTNGTLTTGSEMRVTGYPGHGVCFQAAPPSLARTRQLFLTLYL